MSGLGGMFSISRASSHSSEFSVWSGWDVGLSASASSSSSRLERLAATVSYMTSARVRFPLERPAMTFFVLAVMGIGCVDPLPLSGGSDFVPMETGEYSSDDVQVFSHIPHKR